MSSSTARVRDRVQAMLHGIYFECNLSQWDHIIRPHFLTLSAIGSVDLHESLLLCCVFVVVSTSNNNNVDGWILDLLVCHILFCELSSFLCHATHIREQERKMLRAFNIVRCWVYYPLQWSMKAIELSEETEDWRWGDFVLKYSSKKALGEWGNLHHLSPRPSTHVSDARAIKAKTSKMTRKSESVVTILEWMPADFEFSKLHFYDLLFSALSPHPHTLTDRHWSSEIWA